MPVPDYAMQSVSGKAHQQSFEVTCSIPEFDAVTAGFGSTRRDAEQDAALAMLGKIGADE
jgi:ribonuclease-3